MKKIFLISLFILSGCILGPKNSWESEWVERQDGSYGDWTTANNSNEFSSWTSSIVLGPKKIFSIQSFIEVQSSLFSSPYVGIGIGDGYICGSGIRAKLAWQNSFKQEIETIFFSISKNNKRLIFSQLDERQKNRFLHMLNKWDKLTIQTDDDCGEQTIVRFNIKGTHHMNTTETNPEGDKFTIYSDLKSNI